MVSTNHVQLKTDNEKHYRVMNMFVWFIIAIIRFTEVADNHINSHILYKYSSRQLRVQS